MLVVMSVISVSRWSSRHGQWSYASTSVASDDGPRLREPVACGRPSSLSGRYPRPGDPSRDALGTAPRPDGAVVGLAARADGLHPRQVARHGPVVPPFAWFRGGPRAIA